MSGGERRRKIGLEFGAGAGLMICLDPRASYVGLGSALAAEFEDWELAWSIRTGPSIATFSLTMASGAQFPSDSARQFNLLFRRVRSTLAPRSEVLTLGSPRFGRLVGQRWIAAAIFPPDDGEHRNPGIPASWIDALDDLVAPHHPLAAMATIGTVGTHEWSMHTSGDIRCLNWPLGSWRLILSDPQTGKVVFYAHHEFDRLEISAHADHPLASQLQSFIADLDPPMNVAWALESGGQGATQATRTNNAHAYLADEVPPEGSDPPRARGAVWLNEPHLTKLTKHGFAVPADRPPQLWCTSAIEEHLRWSPQRILDDEANTAINQILAQRLEDQFRVMDQRRGRPQPLSHGHR